MRSSLVLEEQREVEATKLIRVRRIDRLRASGHSVERIAAAIGIPAWRVQRDLEGLNRAEKIIALRTGGSTLEEIAAVMGITRERVRQLERAYGGHVASEERNAAVDPSAVFAAIRDPQTTTYQAIYDRAHTDWRALTELLEQMGLTGAVARLFRWRSHRVFRERIAALCAFVEAETLRTGSVPTIKTIAEHIFGVGIASPAARLTAYCFAKTYKTGRKGLMPRLRVLLGLPKVNYTATPMRKGEVKSLIHRLAARPQGVTIQNIVDASTASYQSVVTTMHRYIKRGSIRSRNRGNRWQPSIYETVKQE